MIVLIIRMIVLKIVYVGVDNKNDSIENIENSENIENIENIENSVCWCFDEASEYNPRSC